MQSTACNTFRFVINIPKENYCEIDSIVTGMQKYEINYSKERKMIVFGKPVHIDCGRDMKAFESHFSEPGLWVHTEDYFGQFYIIEIYKDQVSILSPSSTHGVFFCKVNDGWVVSTDIEEVVPYVEFKPDIEQCFLYTVQNINHEPFKSLLKNVYRAPGLTILKLTESKAHAYPIPLSKIKGKSFKKLLFDTLDKYGDKVNIIHDNPVFAISGGIDGIVLAAAAGLGSEKIKMIFGYTNDYDELVCKMFSSKLNSLGIDSSLTVCKNLAYSKKFDELYCRPVKSNFIDSSYKLRALDNETEKWRNTTTIVNGYGIDEAYEWFRPKGIAYTTVDADQKFYKTDYLISKIFKKLNYNGVSSEFETEKIFAGGLALQQGLYNYYQSNNLKRIARCIDAASAEGYDYYDRKDITEQSILVNIKALNRIEYFAARHYYANSVHLLRFHYLFSNSLVVSSQAWENMPFVSILANLSGTKKLNWQPKSLLFDYLDSKGLNFIKLLNSARKKIENNASNHHKRQSMIVSLCISCKGLIRNKTLRLLRPRSKSKDSIIWKIIAFPVPEEERLRLLAYLKGSEVRLYDDNNENAPQLSSYFESLHEIILQGDYSSAVSPHEVRNYVHLSYMLTHWKEIHDNKMQRKTI